MNTERFEPPHHLSDRGKRLWSEVVPSRARSAGRLALIEEALTSLDRADAARVAISSGSLTTETKTTGAIHVHPLCKVEREARQQFARIWHELGLSWDQTEDGGDVNRWLKRNGLEAAT